MQLKYQVTHGLFWSYVYLHTVRVSISLQNKRQLLLLFRNSRTEPQMHEFRKSILVRHGTSEGTMGKLSEKAEVYT